MRVSNNTQQRERVSLESLVRSILHEQFARCMNDTVNAVMGSTFNDWRERHFYTHRPASLIRNAWSMLSKAHSVHNGFSGCCKHLSHILDGGSAIESASTLDKNVRLG